MVGKPLIASKVYGGLVAVEIGQIRQTGRKVMVGSQQIEFQRLWIW